MSTKDWLLSIVEAVLWFGFIYFWLYVIKHPTSQLPGDSLVLSSLILLAIAYAAILSCPWFRNTQAWKKLWEDDSSWFN
ncbi:MAG: hypothetical protein ABEJ24_01650 [Candidatus Magasanikbacteria bacterium]